MASARRDVALLAPLVIAYVVVLTTGVGGPAFVSIIDNLGETSAALGGATACFLAARRAGPGMRRPWMLLGASALSWGLGQAVWSYFETIAHEALFPSIADIGYLGAIPLGIAALLSFPSTSQAGRMRSVIDGLIIACAFLGLSWVAVLDQVAAASGGGFELVLALAYPVGDVVIIAIALSVLARATDTYRTTVLTISVGIAFLAMADSAFAYNSATDSSTTSPFNVGWVIGYLLFALAARHAGTNTVSRPTSSLQPYWVLVLPFVPCAAFVLLAIPNHLANGVLNPGFTWMGVPLVLLLLVRQLFIHRDNVELTESLQQQIAALAISRESLRHQALHDPLTGLPNRSHLMRELAGRFDGTLAPESALLLMDLDRFKEINDGLGHDVGDLVLTEVARRLREATPAGDTVVRLGGDEFALLIDDPPGENLPNAVAGRLLAALEQPIQIQGMDLRAGVSIGISHSADVPDATRLLQTADVAMYRAKRLGQSVAVYGPQDDEDRPGRLVLLSDLRQLLDQDQLQVHYQPQVDVATGRVIGVEALARWHHPTQGWIAPDAFIPFAEQTGLIGMLTSRVLRKSLAQCVEWRAQGFELHMSVNLSPKALQDQRLVHSLRDAIIEARLPSRCVTLEITESAFAGNTEALIARLERLRSTGVRLSIDDFGTGYSSMSHLKQLPVNELKIDRCFVTDIADDPHDEAIVRSLLALAHTLGLSVVAEGVEDARAMRVLADLGCDAAQGFYLCRPADAATITQWLFAQDADPVEVVHADQHVGRVEQGQEQPVQ